MKSKIPPEHQILSPVEVCILEFGGVRAMGRAINKDPSGISKWSKLHGCIPATVQKKVLEKAWELNLNITPYELIMGRE